MARCTSAMVASSSRKRGACDWRTASMTRTAKMVRAIDTSGPPFQQRPAPRPEPLLPGRIDGGELFAERRGIDVVEREAAASQRRSQRGVRLRLITALAAHRRPGMTLDDRLNVGGQPLPRQQMC